MHIAACKTGIKHSFFLGIHKSMAESKLQRCNEDVGDECRVDRISLLPDEVLVPILSLLSLREASVTSTLARRWRYLSTWTRKLDFDGLCLLDKLQRIIDRTRKHLEDERRNYIKRVEAVISKHKSPTIEEFTLLFNLNKTNSPTIDEWLRFAFSKRVEKLDLNLTWVGGVGYRDFPSPYIFPHHLVGSEEFKLLKELTLNHVLVNREFVKEVIQNCRVLEQLSVSDAHMTDVEIIEPAPSFKLFDISKCNSIKTLVIRDSNIATLKVENLSRIEHVVFENVPRLEELWCWPVSLLVDTGFRELQRRGEQDLASDPYHATMKDIHLMFSSIFPQLRVLKIFTKCEDFKEEDWRNLCSGVEFTNLKLLVVVNGGGGRNRILPVINLLNASPRLEAFAHIMEEQEVEDRFRKMKTAMARARSACSRIPDKYPRLRLLIMVGYHGLHHQFELVMHLVSNGVALRSIILDPQAINFLYPLHTVWDFLPQEEISPEEIEVAHTLQNYIPPRITFETHYRSVGTSSCL